MRRRFVPAVAAVLIAVAGCGNSRHSAAPGSGSGSGAAGADTLAAGFRLEDVAAAAGIRFTHEHGTRRPLTIVETMGGGCAFLDYDGDGRQDAFLVSSGQDFEKASQQCGSRLFRNLGEGRFADVTAASGINFDFYAMGCCAGDFDNDGRIDLFVTGFGRNALLRNAGGRFEDVTTKLGILRRRDAWGTGCAFLDVDRDGSLDLYVANYVRYDPRVPYCPSGKSMSGCTPNAYTTQPNELYMNRGGRFVEMAEKLGATDPAGAGLGVLPVDFDGDGWTDIFVANDGTPNALLHNRRGRFVNVGDTAGVAFAEAGVMRAGMGTDSADYNEDGRPDLVITNFQHEPNSLYRNDGKLLFHETTYPAGVGKPSVLRNGFGVLFVDLNGDGREDLYVGNGHVFDNVKEFDDTASFEQPDQILLNEDGRRFREVPVASGLYPAAPSVTRGLTCGDFDDDGAPDLLINSLGRSARLLRCIRTAPGPWLGLALEGTRSNRSALGAAVTLKTGDRTQTRQIRSGGSYISQSDLRALFALPGGTGPADVTVEIRWPSGTIQRLRPVRLNEYVRVREGKAGS
jgi:hypothetical protein